MNTFIVYFFTIVNNGTAYVIDTMPVDSEKTCMTIVKTVNVQAPPGGRKVRAACYVLVVK